MQIDTNSEYGARVVRRLREDKIGWLTTVGADGTPQPSPIWFLWDGETALIFSKPDAPKVRNIRARPRASLNLHSDASGGDIVILTGEATIDAAEPPAEHLSAYLEKYREGIKGLGMTWEQMAAEYSAVIRFKPAKLRGY